MKVIFTDYDTVKIGTDKEITTKKFFKYFAEAIEYGNITNCNYTPENEEFSFIYDNEKYIIKITNKSIDKLRKLLSLMKIEQNKSSKNKKNITKNENEELLKLARNGEIVSEKAKQLYLKELKSEIKLSYIFKNIKLQNFAYNLFNLDAKKWAEVLTAMLAIFSFTSFLAFLILGLIEIVKATPAFIIVGASFLELMTDIIIIGDVHSTSSSLLARALSYIIWGIINFVGNLIKINIDLIHATPKFISKVSLIKHKIKSLKNYSVPSEEIVTNQKNEGNDKDVLTSYIAKSIDNIYLNLLKLNDEDKKEIRKELETKLKEYQMSLLNLPKSGLTLETEVTVSNRLIMSLAELELKINQKLNAELKSKLITSSIKCINEEIEDNKVKQRVLKM